MVMCFVPDCKHYNERDVCHFYRFPKEELLKKRWIINIRRGDRMPSKHSQVCSCHFKDGKKENGPSIFARDKDNLMVEPEKCPLTARSCLVKFPPNNTHLDEIMHGQMDFTYNTDERRGTFARYHSRRMLGKPGTGSGGEITTEMSKFPSYLICGSTLKRRKLNENEKSSSDDSEVEVNFNEEQERRLNSIEESFTNTQPELCPNIPHEITCMQSNLQSSSRSKKEQERCPYSIEESFTNTQPELCPDIPPEITCMPQDLQGRKNRSRSKKSWKTSKADEPMSLLRRIVDKSMAEEDDTIHFMVSMGQILTKLPKYQQAVLKLKIKDMISEAQIQNLIIKKTMKECF